MSLKQKQIIKLRPFLASISYLSQEANSLGLHKVQNIFAKAEMQLCKYIIDEYFNSEINQRIKISGRDYKHMSKIITAASRMSATEVEDFIQDLEQQNLNLPIRIVVSN